MRTDVKVGLFFGIVALLLVGWFYWPVKTPSLKTTETVQVGGRDSITVDRPVVRPGQNPGSAPEFNVPPPPASVDTSAPKVLPGTTPAVPVPPAPAADVAAAPSNPVMPAQTAALEPTIPSSAAQATAAQPTSPAAIGREPLVHVVRAGDTLEKIAQTYYGNTSLAGALRQANPQLHSKNLRAGTKIKVPAESNLPRITQAPASVSSDASLAVHVDTGVAAVTAVPSTQPAGTMALGPQEYKVQKGDTLYSIATKQLGSGKRWQELLDLNSQILNGKPSSLRPGMVLRLAR